MGEDGRLLQACHAADEVCLYGVHILGGRQVAHVVARVRACRGDSDEDMQDDVEGPTLANCEFSLAYGGKILLNNARLVLKRGRRYGLCGANGEGRCHPAATRRDNAVQGLSAWHASTSWTRCVVTPWSAS